MAGISFERRTVLRPAGVSHCYACNAVLPHMGEVVVVRILRPLALSEKPHLLARRYACCQECADATEAKTELSWNDQ